ncbi:MAG: hypothetical protein WBF62_04770, partial [Bradyrhizobium sp.]
MLLLIIGVSLLREVRAGFHPPRYAAFLTSPSPSFGHSSPARWPDLMETAQIRQTRVALAAAHLDHD